MTTPKDEEQARDALACIAHDCTEILDLEPQAKRITVDFENGSRLRVQRDLIELGPKKAKKLKDVTEQVRDDIAAVRARATSAVSQGTHEPEEGTR